MGQAKNGAMKSYIDSMKKPATILVAPVELKTGLEKVLNSAMADSFREYV